MIGKLPHLPLTTKQVGLVAVILLLIMFGFAYAGRLIASSELQAEVSLWEEEVRLEQQRQERLQKQLAEVQTDAWVIEAARTQLGWAFPGDVAVWMIGAEPSQESATPPAEPTPSWRQWWEQFFGR